MQRPTIYSIVLFFGLTLASATLLIAAQSMSEAFDCVILLQMGSVLFGTGLTIMLLQFLKDVATSPQKGQ